MTIKGNRTASAIAFVVGAVLIVLVLIWTGTPPLVAAVAGAGFLLVAAIAGSIRGRSKP
jgi:Flp pilus assembly protein TadB